MVKTKTKVSPQHSQEVTPSQPVAWTCGGRAQVPIHQSMAVMVPAAYRIRYQPLLAVTPASFFSLLLWKDILSHTKKKSTTGLSWPWL
jgi:hypothetical protein